MTPMVDLMCLLITFFMLTTAFSKPKIMEITMPEKTDKKDEAPATKVQDDRVINVILSGDDKIFWYPGLADPKKPPLPTLAKTDYSKDGIRKILLQRNKKVFKKVESINDEFTRGVLKMTKDYLDYRIKELNKLVEEGKATENDVKNKISEIQTLFSKDDKDMKNEFLAWKIKEIKRNEDKKSPIILIKADDKAKYKNIVDIIDEMYICSIAGYAVVDINDVEKEMLNNAQK